MKVDTTRMGWDPRCNMQTGFKRAADLIRRNGMNIGIKAYNGTGPQSDRYVEQMLPRIEKWRAQIKIAPKQQTAAPSV